MLDKSKVEKFKESFRGRVVQPHDADYDDTRKIYNAMIDKKPQVIAQCANVADVILAVKFGREINLETAIQCGGA